MLAEKVRQRNVVQHAARADLAQLNRLGRECAGCSGARRPWSCVGTKTEPCARLERERPIVVSGRPFGMAEMDHRLGRRKSGIPFSASTFGDEPRWSPGARLVVRSGAAVHAGAHHASAV